MQWLINICKEAMTDTIDALKAWVEAKGYATMAWVQAQLYATMAWVEAKGYLTTSFIDRGDPTVTDFLTGAFLMDGAPHDLDLSGIVPAGAKAVLLTLRVRDSTIGVSVRLRKNGNVNEINVMHIINQIANLSIVADGIVPLDENRIIEYRIPGPPLNLVELSVKGWWL